MSKVRPSLARLSGFTPTLPTPFDANDDIDDAAFVRICDWQIREGAAALVVCGVTGEAPTLTRAEHARVVRIAVGASHGRVPIIAGAESKSTTQAIELAKDAESAGADAILSVVPYYNKPQQAGMEAHFRAIAGATGLPIILHDVPARTVCGLADPTVTRLAESEQFVGLIDATRDVTRPLRLRALLGPQFRLLSGDDATAVGFIAQGGNGCISVAANIAPGLCYEMYSCLQDNHLKDAEHILARLRPLLVALTSESDPGPLKYSLSLLGTMSPRVRLPIVEPRETTKAQISQALKVLPDLLRRFPPSRKSARTIAEIARLGNEVGPGVLRSTKIMPVPCLAARDSESR